MQAVLQISAGVPYPAPSKTSRQRYCLVWISSVKWWCYSQKQEVNSLTNPTRKCHQFIFTYHPASVAQICNFDQHVGPDFSDGIWSLVQQRPLIWNRRCATHSAFIWKEKKTNKTQICKQYKWVHRLLVKLSLPFGLSWGLRKPSGADADEAGWTWASVISAKLLRCSISR